MRNLSRNISKTVADKLFAARGNHSEVHLTREELALVAAAAAEVALDVFATGRRRIDAKETN